MPYTKSDMYYQNYQWSVYDTKDRRISGQPDGTKFSRNEGHEILYLINYLLREFNSTTKTTGQKIERFIKTDLPYNITTQKEVELWIKKYIQI